MRHWPDSEHQWINVADQHLFFLKGDMEVHDLSGKIIDAWLFPDVLKAGTWVSADVVMKL